MPVYAPERGTLNTLAIPPMLNSFTQISDTAAETILVPDTALPANSFNLGTYLRGRIRFNCSNVVTTPGTVTFRIRIGTTTLSATAVVASNAIAMDVAARTAAVGMMDFDIVCRKTGASGTVWIAGTILLGNNLITAAGLIPQLIPALANTAKTFDTTVANILSVSAQFSLTTDPTNIQADSYFLESVGV